MDDDFIARIDRAPGEPPPPSWQIGSSVSATGIYRLRYDVNRNPMEIELLMRRPGDLAIAPDPALVDRNQRALRRRAPRRPGPDRRPLARLAAQARQDPDRADPPPIWRGRPGSRPSLSAASACARSGSSRAASRMTTTTC